MAEDLGDDSAHAEDLRLILSEVDRLAKTTSQLLAIVRPRFEPTSQASLLEVLTGAVGLLRHLANQQGVQLDATLPDRLPAVRGDEHLLWEIFFNLLSNAVEAAGSGGRVSLHSYCRNGCVVTEVRDNGPGLPEHVRARLFEPFLTTKETGTGLGLYVVGRRITEVGGTIRCQSEPNGGTLFTVEIPSV